MTVSVTGFVFFLSIRLFLFLFLYSTKFLGLDILITFSEFLVITLFASSIEILCIFISFFFAFLSCSLIEVFLFFQTIVTCIHVCCYKNSNDE